jgi:hypothetical protein
MTWAEHVALTQDMRKTHTEPEGKNESRRWEDNNKMGLKVNGCKV